MRADVGMIKRKAQFSHTGGMDGRDRGIKEGKQSIEKSVFLETAVG